MRTRSEDEGERVFARLEERGLVERSPDAQDRRRALFTLTEAGKACDAQKSGTVEAAVRRTLGRTSPAALAGASEVLSAVAEELLRDDAQVG